MDQFDLTAASRRVEQTFRDGQFCHKCYQAVEKRKIFEFQGGKLNNSIKR